MSAGRLGPFGAWRGQPRTVTNPVDGGNPGTAGETRTVTNPWTAATPDGDEPGDGRQPRTVTSLAQP